MGMDCLSGLGVYAGVKGVAAAKGWSSRELPTNFLTPRLMVKYQEHVAITISVLRRRQYISVFPSTAGCINQLQAYGTCKTRAA